MSDQITKLRSPRYPVIGLREAIDKVGDIYKSDYRNKIPKDLIASHMGYTSLNGKSLGVVSALSKYGLLEGNRESMGGTSRAVDILERPQGDPDRIQAVREAALGPEVFREIDQQFPSKASDLAIRSFLITKRQYLPDSAAKLIRSYRETQEVVGVECEGYDSTLEVEEKPPMLHVIEPTQPPLHAPSTTPQGLVNATGPLAELSSGEREWIRGPLSRGTSYRLIVSGDLGPREIGKLITLLKAQQAVLSDDEDVDLV